MSYQRPKWLSIVVWQQLEAIEPVQTVQPSPSSGNNTPKQREARAAVTISPIIEVSP